MSKIKKKRAGICCCAVLAAVVVLAAVALALYFTVFRPRAPRVVTTLVDVELEAFAVIPPVLNLSLGVVVTVCNPNYASFRYGEVVTAVRYHGDAVGLSVVPAGEVGARAKETVVAHVEVDAVRVIGSKFFALDVLTGALPFQTATVVAGKAVVLGQFKVSASAEVVCGVSVYVFKRESSSHCTSSVHV